ncbi:helix-turn-helix domain-containing protein [Sphingobacterium oryzagri]|uniref:Helix-turn-helix domain-containing protein n=1 Tax=Sphingobacterium oryzagri TaxID=3025669 RepID=A0ABY7WB46_9SPHI|nr:helix-turn-helix domain-containing protein [Sphingobacterium sp. KACC 22765]WDF66858.1 helix-turn-helix domain-containing protein [Sphingobacterium sp. KACC 22765]
MGCDGKGFKEEHTKELMAVQDSMDVLNGKWKIPIITSVCYYRSRRFSDILNDVKGISNKMLSKELKELEMNKLVCRKTISTAPVVIAYELTEHSRSLQIIIENLTAWGFQHRQKIREK